ncbi:MAG: GTPase Era [Streptosporangiales bacterium]|nr:GTPase Era [Streptosporangiales bacterium]
MSERGAATADPAGTQRPFVAGFACLVGRPNVGKSTLTNALVGQKVAITSNRPQTTRHTVRGIVHRDDGQLVLVDTPGLHRPRTLLGERLNDVVLGTLSEVDVIGLCLPADERSGPGDRYLVEQLRAVPDTPVVAVVTKTDLVDHHKELPRRLVEASQLLDFAEVVPVSATEGVRTDVLADVLVGLLPEGRPLYPDGELTNEPEQVLVAELIREAVLEDVRDELPHSIAVSVEEMQPRTNKELVDIYATVYVERPSQKGIVIGRQGVRLREVGARARQRIEAMLGTSVYLDLHVKVLKDWQRDPRQLHRLGF